MNAGRYRFGSQTTQPHTLVDDTLLEWEGPTDHFAEQRILDANKSADEIHLFYRDRHHTSFVYRGRLRLIGKDLKTGKESSRFVFKIIQ